MTILNQYVERIPIDSTWGFSTIGLICGLCALGGLLLLLWALRSIDWETDLGMFLAVLAVTILFAIGSFTSFSNGTTIYKEIPRYEVIFDENLTIQEFLDKYEIIERRGEIYIISEKE